MINRRLIFKRVLISAVIIVAVVTLAIAIIVQLFLTPEKLTPLVTEKIQEHINTQVSIKKIDVTFLSTYPWLTLKIDSLRIMQPNDSISDLLSTKSCKIEINPIALLFKKVIFNKVKLAHPSINLYRDSTVKPLQLINMQIDTVVVDTTENILNINEYSFALKRVVVDSSVIVINDKIKDFYSKVDGFSLDVGLIINDKKFILDAETDIKDITVSNMGNTLISNLTVELNSDIELNKDSLLLTFKQADLRLNNINLCADGLLKGDTIKKTILVDINGALKTPSLAEFINLVPDNFLDNKDELITEGDVALNIKLSGIYSKTHSLYPNLTAELEVVDGKAKFKNRKVSIDNVDCNANMFVDFNTPKNSYISLNSVNINSLDIIKLSLKGKINDIINAPTVDMNVISILNFSRFSEVFPLKNGISFNGTCSSDLQTQFRIEDIKNSNYSKLFINGDSHLKDIDISIDGAKFNNDSTLTSYMYLEVKDGILTFGDRVKRNKSRTLLANINFNGLGFKDKDGQYLLMKNLALSAGANFDQKSGKPNGIGMRATASDLDLGVENMLRGGSKSSEFIITITPKTEEKNAHIHATVKSSSINASESINSSELSASNVDMVVDLTKIKEKKWDTDSKIGFNNFNLFSQMFPLNIAIPKSSIVVKNNEITLDNTNVNIGKSEMVLTGNISNMMQALFSIDSTRRKKLIYGSLEVKSKLIDANELMEATNKGVLLAEAEAQAKSKAQADSITNIAIIDSTYIANLVDSTATESSLPLIPKGISFALNLKVDTINCSNTYIDNINGKATIKKGVLHINKLKFSTIGADGNATLSYNNINRERANLFFEMDFKGVDISRIGELIPSVDTLMPMIKSFEGDVDCNIRGTTILNSELYSELSTLKCGISMRGKELVLMDSETFTELSKKLMFKNKKRNIIDSLNVDITVDTLNINVLPFEVSIDRYKAIVGGDQMLNEQTLDIVYNYNVSIIKSPLPFKAGVDIFGDLNDYDFNITKAKLKNTDFKLQKEMYNRWINNIMYKEIRDSLFFTNTKRKANKISSTNNYGSIEEENR